MPVFKLNTNLSKCKIPKGFAKETAQIIADSMNKPVQIVCVQINADRQMCWGGTDDLCAIGTLQSIGVLELDDNRRHSEALFTHIEKKLGIPQNRMYITYFDVKDTDMSFMGKTMYDVLPTLGM